MGADGVAVEMTERDEPSELQRIASALPRKKVMFVLVVVLLNLLVVTYLRGRAISRARLVARFGVWEVSDDIDYHWSPSPYITRDGRVGYSSFGPPEGCRSVRDTFRDPPLLPPWEWTAAEWRETVWPWR